MMNGNIHQLNILAAVEDQSRTEPRFMPDYQSVGQNSVRQIRYSDQTVPFQQSAVRNLNTPVIPDQFLFFRVERADDELTGKIVAEIFGKMQPAVFETVFSADFQPAELSVTANDVGVGHKGIFKINGDPPDGKAGAVFRRQRGNPPVKTEFRPLAGDPEIFPVPQIQGDGFDSLVIIGEPAVTPTAVFRKELISSGLETDFRVSGFFSLRQSLLPQDCGIVSGNWRRNFDAHLRFSPSCPDNCSTAHSLCFRKQLKVPS